MVTALDLRRRGVVFGRARDGRPTVQAPADLGDLEADELAREVRDEVRRRERLVVDMPPLGGARVSRCDACGDELAVGRGGLCGLCSCARWRVVEAVLARREGLGG